MYEKSNITNTLLLYRYCVENEIEKPGKEGEKKDTLAYSSFGKKIHNICGGISTNIILKHVIAKVKEFGHII